MWPVVRLESWRETLRWSSVATLVGLGAHYACFYAAGTPLITDWIAEWIMARTPSRDAIWILGHLDNWAKPSALTGALAALGLALFLTRALPRLAPRKICQFAAGLCGGGIALAATWFFGYRSLPGSLSFWIPAVGVAAFAGWPRSPALRPQSPSGPAQRTLLRRTLLSPGSPCSLPLAMAGGVIAVAAESYLREKALIARAAPPTGLFPFSLPEDHFAPGLVRPLITPLPQFYGMSKNVADPVVDVSTWRLSITIDGKVIRRYSYAELLALREPAPRYVTLRCISNTLKSDLMGTAEWSGVRLARLIGPHLIPSSCAEVAFLGSDGHDDSMRMDYAFGDECLLALGMNGKTLNRTHGFPLRLLAPRYYGCRNVKWLSEIRFVSAPYFGTWQRLGYTKEPVIHVASHIDHIYRVGDKVRCGGVSFAGSRGIKAVRVRTRQGPWYTARLEAPLSCYTWTRWTAELPAARNDMLEANAQAGDGEWQETVPGNPFPTGPSGPTLVRVNV